MKYTINKDNFSKRLTELMQENNETIYTLASQLHLSSATISRYTNGLMAPKITTVSIIAQYFNVNNLWLMGYDEPKHITSAANSIVEVIGHRVKALREKRGLSLESLGEKMHVQEAVIAQYERGETQPDLQTLLALSKALRCSVDYLVGETENPSSKNIPASYPTEELDGVYLSLAKEAQENALDPEDIKLAIETIMRLRDKSE